MSEPSRPVRVSGGYLGAVLLIYLVTAAAWAILGTVTAQRTRDKDSDLRAQVGQLWGGEHRQAAPQLIAPAIPRPAPPAGQPGAAGAPPPTALAVEDGIPDACRPELELGPEQTRARAALDLEHRRKGLLWYSTYRVRFDARYAFSNPSPCVRDTRLVIPLPARGAIYDELSVRLGDVELPLQLDARENAAVAQLRLKPGERRQVTLRYNSRGLDRWSYSFGHGTGRAKDFDLRVQTSFSDVDFAEGTLSPTHKRAHGDGWALGWRFGNIVAGTDIAISMPHRINPGPLASQISLFAPVSLAFFFFVLLLVSVIRRVRLHPVHYAMLAAAFFSFHLLFAYLVDLVPVELAFGIASLTSVGLVVSYLRLAVGGRFALLWAGGAQLLYLVLFSLAFFLEGYTGLTITIFSVLTLFVVMQLTGRIDWGARFGRRDAPLPAPSGPAGAAGGPLFGSARRGDEAADAGAFSRVG